MTPEQQAALLRAKQTAALQRAKQQVSAPAGGVSVNSEAADELGGKLKAMAAGAVNAATLGFADEATGVVGGLMEAPGDGTFAEGYASSRDAVRGEHEALQGADPGPYGVGQVGGVLATLPIAGAGTAAKGTGLLPRVGRSATTGAAYGGAYGFGQNEGMDDRLAGMQSGMMTGGIIGGVTPVAGAGIQKYLDQRAKAKAIKAMMGRAKSVDDLKADAGALYDDAARNGASASPTQTAALADKTAAGLVDEGLTGPSGAISPGYQGAAGNQALLMDFADSAMNPKQMQEVRRQLMETARKSGSEGRIGSQMVNAFDETMEPLAPQIKQGNEVYSRAMKADKLEKMRRLAEEDAGVNYSQAGLEQALRRRFSNLHKKIIEGKEQGWTADEVAAISKVANGGKLENTARNIGRAAPSGIVNIGLGGGMPYLIGNTMGGPAVGAAMGAGTLAAGSVGRKIATALQSKNADIAKALAATGEKMPQGVASDALRKKIESLIRRGGAVTAQ